MISLADALQRVLADCRPLEIRALPLDEALGCVLGEAVTSTAPVPPFANTAMDGYAVRAADTAGASAASPARLKVIGTLAAGAAPTIPVGPGEALRIMTGAPFPTGADAIAIVETTEPDGDGVAVLEPARPGVHIRPAGEDFGAGQQVFAAGTTLGPGHLGVLASLGRAKVTVWRRAVVGVLSTGDELVEAAEELQPGQIRDSNRRTLLALLRRDGYDAVDLGIARDDEAEIRAAITGGVAGCDAVLTSGGVSMGDFDYVKKVLDEIGDMVWMQVAIRPAKPLAFGTVGSTPVFGLPGNPVSSMVSYELFARPGLRRMTGHPDGDLERPRVLALVDDDSLRRFADGRVAFSRVVAHFGPDGRCHVRGSGGQGSHQLLAMANANALAVVPDGPGLAAGDEVETLLLG